MIDAYLAEPERFWNLSVSYSLHAEAEAWLVGRWESRWLY